MSNTTTIPATVSDEAAARIAELGVQGPFDRMVEQAVKIPGLRRLEVSLAPAYDAGDDPRVILDAICDGAVFDPADPTGRTFSEWKVTTFPPEVFRHFCLLTSYESSCKEEGF